MLRMLEFQLGELWVNLRRNGLLTAAAMATVACALTVVGVVWLTNRNFERLLAEQAEQALIACHLEKGLDEPTLAEIRAAIEQVPGVKSLEYISPEAGWERWKKQIGLDAQLLEGESRLPPKYNVEPADPEQTGAIAEQLKHIPGVDDVRYGGEVVDKLNALVRLVRQTAAVALLMLSLATFTIIANAIRLTIYARRREIRIMQLVGAHDSFISVPFVLEGLVDGTVGAGLACIAVSLLYSRLRGVVTHSASFVRLLDFREVMPEFAVGLIALGMLFGAASSLIAVRRFLQED